MDCAVAEWSKALEKINENHKIPGSPPPPTWAIFKKGISEMQLVLKKVNSAQ